MVNARPESAKLPIARWMTTTSWELFLFTSAAPVRKAPTTSWKQLPAATGALGSKSTLTIYTKFLSAGYNKVKSPCVFDSKCLTCAFWLRAVVRYPDFLSDQTAWSVISAILPDEFNSFNCGNAKCGNLRSMWWLCTACQSAVRSWSSRNSQLRLSVVNSASTSSIR